ncbi:MAG: hypothetical protein IKZ56_02565 [Bacteroidales bacterium]|nr:hypothetical protein [Bacteroidales bacterium]
MAKSGKSSKYSVLCVAVALGCSLFGILLGVSLNLNSHDVLASYRSSMTTLAQNNEMLSDMEDAEWTRLCNFALEKKDSLLFCEVSDLSDASVIYHYLDSLRAAFILYVDGEPNEQLHRLDAVSESTYFMMDQGNARELRARLQQYQDHLNSFVGEDTAYVVDFRLQDQSWEDYHFANAMSVEVVNQLDLIEQQLRMADISVFKYVAGERWKKKIVND